MVSLHVAVVSLETSVPSVSGGSVLSLHVAAVSKVTLWYPYT